MKSSLPLCHVTGFDSESSSVILDVAGMVIELPMHPEDFLLMVKTHAEEVEKARAPKPRLGRIVSSPQEGQRRRS